MPDPNTSASVNVYFFQYNMMQDENPVFTFLYNPTIVQTLTAAPAGTTYTVAFNLVSNIPGATLSSENTVSGAPPNLASTGSGTTALTVTFTNDGLTATDTFNYTLSVSANGQTYTSDDPEILLPPPS